jgi:integrase
MKISDTWLLNAKPRADRYDVTVTNRKGLMVRVHPSGVIAFRFRYKRAGKTFVMVFGEYGKQGISLKRAFEMHEVARSEIEQNLDPIEEQEKRMRAAEKARIARAAAGTVAYIVDQFMHRRVRAERWDKDTHSWVRDTKSTIRPRKRPDKAWELLGPNLVDPIGTQKACDVTKGQLVNLLDDIVDRGAPVQANRVYGIVKQCFSFAASKDLIPASPMAGVEKPGGIETPRERALNDDEICAFWTRLESSKMNVKTQLALKLLLVTGQRRGEVTQASWYQVDFDACMWTIPKEISKTGKEHRVPLSALGLQIFKELRAITGKGLRLFPHHRRRLNPNASYTERALTHAVNRNRKHFGIAHFTPHDLRRTVSTRMTSIGIPRLHVEKVLSHSVSDVAEIYDRHDYFKEKKAALDRWGDHLQDIIENRQPKVVPIRKSDQAAA